MVTQIGVVLSERQQARVECLKAARECLVARGPLTASAVDSVELVSVARYIETGQDPWVTEAADDE